MHRRSILLTGLALICLPLPARADAFDYYLNPVLSKVPKAEGVKELKRLTPELMQDHDRVLAGITAAFVVVQTNEQRYGKLLVQPAHKKIGDNKRLPILIIERFVTYREGQERAIQARGKEVILFPGFRFSLDLGQVVPEELGGDLRLVADGDQVYVEPLGQAKLFLVTKPLPEAAPKKSDKLVVGETFEPRYFNGKYQLFDDGRRSGTLTLQVGEGGEVTGAYFSDRDGQKYEVRGKLGKVPHAVQFVIKFPRVEQTFNGWLFTGDARALTGWSRLLEREAGFYALRMEE
jgi:hypothetical protein